MSPRLPSLLLALAPAQADHFDVAEMQHLGFPSGVTPGAEGRLVAGDVTRDWRPDLVLVHGGKPVVFYGPQVFDSEFEVDFAANDVALLPEPAPSLNHTLMVVNSCGLFALSGYDGGEYTATERGSSDWEGATRLVRGDTDDDGVLDLVGISAQNELLIIEDLHATPTELEPRAIYGTVLDVATVDWWGTGTADIALLTTAGMFVIEKDGTSLFAMYGSPEHGRLARLTEDGLGHERVAVLWEYDTEQYLVVIDRNGLVETPIDVTEHEVFAMTSGDFDGNGDDDLYLVSAGDHVSNVLYNQSASESYTFGLASGESEEIVLGAGTPSGWAPFPAAGDVDQDGDVDLAVYLEASDELVWLPNQSASPEAWHPVVYGGHYTYSWTLEEGHLDLFVEPPEVEPFDSTDVQVMTFLIEDYSDLTTPMEPIPIEHRTCPWNTEGETVLDLVFEGIEDDEDGVEINDVFVSIIRLVRKSGGVIVEVGPSAAHAFTTPANVTDELSFLFDNGVEIRTWEQDKVAPEYEYSELYPPQLSERELAPKDVKIQPAPPSEPPPDPMTFP